MKGTLAQVASLVSGETGIALPAAREDALRTALRRAAPGADPAGFLRAVADPAQGAQLLGRLIDEVTVQETFFARDVAQLRVIPWASLRTGRARGGPGGPVRVWSAGCATGEEAYTLALEAMQALGPGPARWTCSAPTSPRPRWPRRPPGVTASGPCGCSPRRSASAT